MSASSKTFKVQKLDGHLVRAMIDERGAVWLTAPDFAGPLMLSPKTVSDAIKTYPPFFSQVLEGDDAVEIRRLSAPKQRVLTPEKTGSQKGKKARRGGATSITAITEEAAHFLIARSKAAITPGTFAFDFCRWVFNEVIPSLQKRGSYQMNKRAKELVQGHLGWKEIRADGKQVRKGFADIIAGFIAYARRQGSNHAGHYYEVLTKLADTCARLRGNEGLRDWTEETELARLAVVEERIGELLAAAMADGLPYKAVYARVKAEAERLFISAPLVPAPWLADPEDEFR